MGNCGETTVINATCEAFAARFSRLVVTAADGYWLDAANQALCGYGTSLIGCDAEIALERMLSAEETPDGRIGSSILAFAFRAKPLGKAVANRVGQAVLTCPTAAIFDGLPDGTDRAPLGDYLRYFGDGHERPTESGWVVPVMEGEVAFPSTLGIGRGIAGGNLLLCGRNQPEALAAVRRSVEAVRTLPGIITPFPGGACRSGSKVGSQYQGLVASTNEPFSPTLRDSVETKLPDGTQCVYELILNGVDENSVREGMAAALAAATDGDLLAVTAADYGGKLGSIQIPLDSLLDSNER